MEDLNARVDFLKKWVRVGIPPAFWISGFYFPQAFLTGTLQNFARKYIVSIDTINFTFQVLLTFIYSHINLNFHYFVIKYYRVVN